MIDMHKTIRILFILTLGLFLMTSYQLEAQEQAPSYQTLVSKGDKEFNNKEYIKAKAYYQEALRVKPNDANAKSKLNKTLQKIREENKKEEQFLNISTVQTHCMQMENSKKPLPTITKH